MFNVAIRRAAGALHDEDAYSRYDNGHAVNVYEDFMESSDNKRYRT